MLPFEEERALIKTAQQGCTRSRNKLYLVHKNYIRTIVKRYSGPSVELEDLIQAGALGFMLSVDKFDLQVSSHGRIGQYASFRIRDEVFKLINQSTHGLRIYQTKPEKKVFSNLGRYTDDAGTLSSDSAKCMASELNVSLKDIHTIQLRLLANNKRLILNDEEIGDDANSPCKVVIDQCEREYNKKVIAESLDSLSELEAIVFKARNIHEQYKRPTFRQIGEELGVTFQRVCQLEKNAIKKIHNKVSEKIDMRVAA